MAKSERFAFVKEAGGGLGLAANAQVIVDKKTGVNYLFVCSGYSGGLTPLLDRDGKPLISGTVTLEE